MVKRSPVSRLSIFISAFLALTTLCFFAIGCSRVAGNSATIKGTVYSTYNSPLSGALATVISSMGSSDSSGIYTISKAPIGDEIVVITASGYTPSYRRVTSKANVTRWAPLAILAPLDSKITMINSDGGQVLNTPGNVKLTVPSGGLSGNTLISLTGVPLKAAPVSPPYNFQFIALIVYLTPNTVTLSSPATLSIPNLTNLPSGTSVAFYHLNTSLLEWQLITGAGGVASLEAGVITAQITQFGWTAAIIPIAPNAGTITGTITDYNTGLPIENASVWSGYLSALTDSAGGYVLTNSPTGEVSLECVANGYDATETTVFVNPGSSTVKNLTLMPISGGTVEGTILSSISRVPIVGARVWASNSMETTTNSQGYYSFSNVDAGPIEVIAYANGYLPNGNSGSLQNNSTLTLNFYMTQSGSASAWVDDFETDRLWTKSNGSLSNEVEWQRLDLVELYPTVRDGLAPAYVTLPDYGSTLGSLPLPQSENCAYWFGQIYGEPIIQGCYIADQEIGDPDKSGGTTAGEKYVNRDLISPVIDISNFGSATLSFWTWWEIEGRNPGSGYDRMEVYVSKGPTYYPWTRVALLNPVEDPDHTISALHPDWPYSSGGYNQPARWIQHKLNLNSFLGNQIKIKFAFNSWDSQFNGFRGWLIDNLGVYPEALSASQISSSSVDLRPDHGEVTPTLR